MGLIIIREPIKVRRNVLVEVHDVRTGRLLHSERGSNLVVAAGLAGIALATAGDITQSPQYLGAGTGTTAITLGDTSLENEVGSRVLLGSTTGSGYVGSFKGMFGSSELNGNTLSNVGLFDSASGTNLLSAYILATTVAKTTSISLTISWTWAFENA